MRRRRNTAGFTLFELALGMTIFAVLLGAVLLAQRSTAGLVTSTATSVVLEQKALRGVESVASETRWADVGALLVTEENGSDRLDIRTPTAFVDDETAWSTTITYRVEPSAIDSDDNGVLDEGRLVRIQDGVTRKLCEHVVAGGFSAQWIDEQLLLQLSVAKMDGTTETLLTADATTSISLRN